MRKSFLHRNIMGCVSISALAALAAIPSASALAQSAPAAGLSAADATALCARVGLKPPATLAAALAAPAAGAADDQIRAWCAALGFQPVAVAASPQATPIVSVGTYLKSGSEDTSLNVEVQSRDDLLRQGGPDANRLIRQLSESGPTDNGASAGPNIQGYGMRTLNLRDLGSGRTLTLYDGVRLADDPQRNGGPAITYDPNVTGGGSQNVNGIPMEVLQQVQILKNAGSAADSAGAVGGAVNFAPAPPKPGLITTAPPPPPGTERYPQASPNPIKQVASEPVSTFSIDTDTASYSNVRRFLHEGQRPPAEAVRIEELVNYFDYGYAQPASRNEPFRPFVAVAPSPWSPGKQLVHIGIQGFAPPHNQEPPLNLVFLVDTSGSMDQPDREPLVKKALDILTEQLRPQDRVSIVAYAGVAGLVLAPTTGADKALIERAVNGMQPGGGTAGAAGLSLAYSLAERNFDKNAVNRIVLMTDGDFNVGATDNKRLEDYVAAKRQTGIYLSVYGFGRDNYQDARMQAIAQNGNGTAAYIDSLEEARKVFRDDFSGSMFPIADDVKIQVEFNPARVAEYRLIGYETRMLRREDFNNDKVDAGEVGAGVSVTALYEITPVGGPTAIDPLRYGRPEQTAARTPADASGELANLKIRYKLPGEQTSKLISRPISNSDTYRSIQAAPESTRWAAAVAAYGQKLRYDNYVGNGFTWDDDIKLAQSARGQDDYGLRAEFIQLVRDAEALTTQRAGL